MRRCGWMWAVAAAWVGALATMGLGATTLYVNDTATGANDGTSWADAYTQIGAAVAAIAAGTSSPITILVAPGTYAEPTATRVNFDADCSGKTISVQYSADSPDGAGTATLANATSFQVYFSAAYAATTAITWDGIHITMPSATSSNQIRFADADQVCTVTIQNCTVTNTQAGLTARCFELLGQGRTGRTITLQNVTFNITNPSLMSINSVGTLTVDGCTFTKGSGVPSVEDLIALAPNSGDAFNAIEFVDCTFTSALANSGGRWVIQCDYGGGALRVRDCTFTHLTGGIVVGGYTSGTTSVQIEGCTFNATGNNSAQIQVIRLGSDADVSALALGRVVVHGNVIHAGTGSQAIGAIQLGPEVDGAVVTANQAVNTQEGVAAVGFYFRHADYGFFEGNAVKWDIPCAVIEGTNATIRRNSFHQTTQTSHGALVIRDSNTARASFTDGSAGTHYYDPVNLVVEDNVLSSTSNAAINIWSHSGGRTMVKDGWRIDRNVYWASGTADVALVDAVAKTFGELQDFWAAVPTTTDAVTGRTDAATMHFARRNDAQSESADPQFVNAASGDLRIRPDSPARGTQSGSAPSLATWNDRGAWQRRNAGRVGPMNRGVQ